VNFIKTFLTKIEDAKELTIFFWKIKLWFLIPLILVLLILGILLMVASSTGVAPFIYTLI